MNVHLQTGDALLVVDVQVDFVSGSLAVPGGMAVVPALNRYITMFRERSLPVVATRDWHPANHSSFRDQGGRWPPHCVAGTEGARFAADLGVEGDMAVVSKATKPAQDAYSAFDGTELNALLRRAQVTRLFVGGLATEYCVLATVLDALRLGYRVFLLADAIAAVDVEPGDGDRALRHMREGGAMAVRIEDLVGAEPAHG